MMIPHLQTGKTILYLFFIGTQIVFGYSKILFNACQNNFIKFQNEKVLWRRRKIFVLFTFLHFFFFPVCTVFGMLYSVFEKLDCVLLFVFVLWYFESQLVFDIQCLLISERQFIFGICIQSTTSICHVLRSAIFWHMVC